MISACCAGAEDESRSEIKYLKKNKVFLIVFKAIED